MHEAGRAVERRLRMWRAKAICFWPIEAGETWVIPPDEILIRKFRTALLSITEKHSRDSLIKRASRKCIGILRQFQGGPTNCRKRPIIGPYHISRVQNQNDGLDDRSVHELQVRSKNLLPCLNDLRQVPGCLTLERCQPQHQVSALDWYHFNVYGFQVWRYLPTSFQSGIRKDSSRLNFSQRDCEEGSSVPRVVQSQHWFRDNLRFHLDL